VVRAYIVASEIFDTDSIWGQIEALDNQVVATVQTEMLSTVAGFLEQTLTAVLRSYKDFLNMQALSERFHDGVAELGLAMPKPLAAEDKREFDRHVRKLVRAGVTRELAQQVAALIPLSAALDIVEVATATDTQIETAAWVYSALSHTLDLDWIGRQIAGLSVQTHWHLLARTKLQAALNGHRRNLTAEVLRSRHKEKSGRGILEGWVRQNRTMLDRHNEIIAEFKAGSVFDFAILSLVVAGVGELLPSGLGVKAESVP
jgi:glutamate dehydrogenase